MVVFVAGIYVPPFISGSLREYCQWESFNVTCAEDEVILIKSARYGRMQLGRCVSKNYGYVGCSVDMLQHVDAMCSGRRSCKFAVPTDTMRTRRPCPKDFSSYLDASYICLKGRSFGGSLLSDVLCMYIFVFCFLLFFWPSFFVKHITLLLYLVCLDVVFQHIQCKLYFCFIGLVSVLSVT